MISTNTALQSILQNSLAQKTCFIKLNTAQGFVLSQPVISPIHFPSFPQSAMDGYALRKNDLDEKKMLEVQDVIQAGDTRNMTLEAGKAIRLFTGAPVPDGTDTVVMQEWIHREGNLISLASNAQEMEEGMNIRSTGSQTKQNEKVMNAGDVLTPAAISFLSGLGIIEVEVYTKPRVAILTTGKELIQPGEPLQYGQIYESNSAGLISALNQMHLKVVASETCDDDLPSTVNKIQHLLSSCDVLLITGGVSVGDYDFVTEALHEVGVNTLFHKVKQKPGKPFYAGRKNQQLIFGLPGNPASVMTCFYMYVYPSLRAMSGCRQPSLPEMDLILHSVEKTYMGYTKKKGLTHFLKGRLYDGQVIILRDQESYKMNSFATANAIVMIPEETEGRKRGDTVRTFILPF